MSSSSNIQSSTFSHWSEIVSSYYCTHTYTLLMSAKLPATGQTNITGQLVCILLEQCMNTTSSNRADFSDFAQQYSAASTTASAVAKQHQQASRAAAKHCILATNVQCCYSFCHSFSLHSLCYEPKSCLRLCIDCSKDGTPPPQQPWPHHKDAGITRMLSYLHIAWKCIKTCACMSME